MIREKAPAKINLALHVTGQRADGYHLLDSLVVFAGLGDELTFEPASDLSLSITGPLAKGVPVGPSNLVLQAAALFGKGLGARIALDKRLPHAAGIGGGSADAAATLRGLARLWNRPLPGPDACLSLGADVPVCLSTAPQRMRGIGEDLTPLPTLPTLHVVLVNPRVPVPTGPVFKALPRKDNPAMETPTWAGFEGFVGWLARQRNDLEPAAIGLAPAVGDALAALAGTGAALARMSGSGATCFGLYENRHAAEKAAQTIATRHPAWWVESGEILG